MKRRRFSLEVRPGAVVLLSGLYFLLRCAGVRVWR